jgi:hypothetical protein
LINKQNNLSTATHLEAQKLANAKAITTLVKTTPSDRSLQKPTHSESQKLANDEAIATVVKTTQSERLP